MSLALLLVFLGIANWLGTTILVEAEITRDYREWIGKQYDKATTDSGKWTWYKLKYLVGCHLCTGIWVGMVMALFVPSVIPVTFVGWVLTGLSIKGIGHMVLVLHKLGEAVSNKANATAEKTKAENEAISILLADAKKTVAAEKRLAELLNGFQSTEAMR